MNWKSLTRHGSWEKMYAMMPTEDAVLYQILRWVLLKMYLCNNESTIFQIKKIRVAVPGGLVRVGGEVQCSLVGPRSASDREDPPSRLVGFIKLIFSPSFNLKFKMSRPIPSWAQVDRAVTTLPPVPCGRLSGKRFKMFSIQVMTKMAINIPVANSFIKMEIRLVLIFENCLMIIKDKKKYR